MIKNIPILTALGLFLVLVSACSEQDEPQQYTKPKPDSSLKLAELTQRAWLREKLPESALAYARVPSIWFPFAGLENGFQYAQGNQAHVEQIRNIQQGVYQNLLDQADPSLKPLFELIAKHITAPLEVAALANEQNPMLPSGIVATRVDFSDLDSFKQAFEGLLQQQPMIQITKELDNNGRGAFGVPMTGASAFYQFDPKTGQLAMVIGMGATTESLEALYNGLQGSESHPMYASERQIDASAQGLFVYFNMQQAFASARGMLPAEQMMAVAMTGADKINSIAFGYGASNEKTRLKVLIDMPMVGFKAFLPAIANKYEVKGVGEINTMGVLTLPRSEQFKRIEGAALMFGGGNEEYVAFKKSVQETTGQSLEQIIDLVGPELIYFSDEVGDFAALRLNNKEALYQLLNKFPDLGIQFSEHEREGVKIHHLSMPLLRGAAAEELGSASPLMARILFNIKSHYYWVEDGGFLIFSSVPQALVERASRKPSASLEDWLSQSQRQDLSSAFLAFTTSHDNLSRKAYHFYLQMLQSLADISQANYDPFVLPHAGQLGFADKGSLGVSIDMSEQYLGIEFVFEQSLSDLLYSTSFSGVAALGIMAAVAVPAYQDYVIRAEISTALAQSAEIQEEIENLVAEGTALEQIDNGSGEILGAFDYASDSVDYIEVEDGRILILFGGRSGKAAILGQTIEISPMLDDESDLIYWDCTGGSLAAKFRPTKCRP